VDIINILLPSLGNSTLLQLLAYVDVNPYKLCPNFVGVSLMQRFGLKEVRRGKGLRIIQV
jgi:hypothetical protein